MTSGNGLTGGYDILENIASRICADGGRYPNWRVRNDQRMFPRKSFTLPRIMFLMGSWTKVLTITLVSELIMLMFIFRNLLQTTLFSFLINDVLASTVNFLLKVVIGVMILFPIIFVLTVIFIKARLSSLEVEDRTSSVSERKERDLSWFISFAASAVINSLVAATVAISFLASTLDIKLTVLFVGIGVLVTYTLILPFWWTTIQVVNCVLMRGLLTIFDIDGLSSSSKPSPNPPPDIRKFNKSGSLWEFHSPPQNQTPEVEIVFFHDLQLQGDYKDAFWTTWCARNDDNLVWPKAWLPEKIPNARIVSTSYNSSFLKKDEPTDLSVCGEIFVHDIILDDQSNIGQHCPVVLVGHGLGGLVIKEFVLHALTQKARRDRDKNESERATKFLGNLKGVFYYSTPHVGSRVGDLLNLISYLVPSNRLPFSAFAISLQSFNISTARLFESFKLARLHLKIKTFSMGEHLPIRFKGVSIMKVVTEASARLDSDSFFCGTNTDHFTVCQPKSENDVIILKLVRFIGDVVRTSNSEMAISEMAIE